MQFFIRNWKAQSLAHLQKMKKLHSVPKITKAQIRMEKINQLRDLWVEVKHNVTSEDLEALCQEYKIVVNETTILNNIKK